MPDLNSLEHIPCALLIVDRDLKPISASRKGVSVFGVRLRREAPKQELEALHHIIWQEPDLLDRVRKAIARIRRPGAEAQFRWERIGRVYQVTVKSLNRGGDTQRYALLFDDVTQQIQFEETRELARRYLEDVLNNVHLGVVVFDREMRITNMNRAHDIFLHRLGVHMSWVDAIGMSIPELMPQDSEVRWDEINSICRFSPLRDFCLFFGC